MIPPFTPEQQAQAQAIIDDACESDSEFARAWYAECEKQSQDKPGESTIAAHQTSRASSPAVAAPHAATLLSHPAPATSTDRASREGVGV